MTQRPIWLVGMVLTAVTASAQIVHGQQTASDAAAAPARRYIEEYQRQLSGVVGQERQTQRDLRADGSVRRQRELVADVLLVRSGERLLMFRDVIEVDGRPVSNRADRLRRLFLEGHRDALAQGKAISKESARFNLGVTRILDSLLLPITILSPWPTPRFTFTATEQGLKFDETLAGTMIRGGNGDDVRDMPLRGWLSIEPETGQLLAASMRANNPLFDTTVDIRYEQDPAVDLLVPVTMRQRHTRGDQSRPNVLEVSSTYANWRRFKVQTSETLDMPK